MSSSTAPKIAKNLQMLFSNLEEASKKPITQKLPPALKPLSVIQAMLDAYQKEGRHLLFHTAAVIESVKIMSNAINMTSREKRLALLAALYHDAAKINFTYLKIKDPIIAQLLNKKYGHSLAIQRLFLYFKIPELAKAVRHNSPDFLADYTQKNITRPQLLLNIADRIEFFGGPLRGNSKKSIAFNNLAEEASIKIITDIYTSFLLGNYSKINQYPFILKDKMQKKTLVIVGRFDSKYHAPWGVFQDTSSGLKISQEMSLLGWHSIIMHRSNYPNWKKNNITVRNLNGKGKATSFFPLLLPTLKKADMVIVEGWTELMPFISNKIKNASIFTSIIFRGMKGGKLSTSRAVSAASADEIWGVSKKQIEVIEKSLKHLGIKTSVRLISNGIDPQIFKINPAKKRIPGKVVYVGALVPEKGVDLLVKAMRRTIKVFPHAKLHLIGTSDMYGASLKSFDAADNNNIILHGQLTHREIAHHLQSAHITVLFSKPNLFETFGKSIEEAKACGSRFLVSKSGALPERIESPSDGKIIHPLTIQNISNALTEELNKKPTRRKIYHPKYTWRLTAIEIITAYLEFLRNNISKNDI